MGVLSFFSRIFVGVLFIISGLIKLNDPIGFSYKLQEYFSAEVLHLPFLEPYALVIAIFVVVLEVILGVFLLIGYRPKFTLWSLLLLIIFFTFLTFYSAYFDKVKDCGCFGDALKLTPWESFFKDLVLLAFILILFFNSKRISPVFPPLPNTILAVGSLLGSLWFGYHVLMHLPVLDFRAYKIGDNLIKNMDIPADAPKAVQEFIWTFEVDGVLQEYTTSGAYPQVNGIYKGVESTIIKEGYQPPILDFSIESAVEDYTDFFLNQPKLIIIVSYDLDTAEADGLKSLKSFSDNAITDGYTVIGLSASSATVKERIKKDYELNFEFYLCDEKALKTVVRANPGVLKLSSGLVLQKAHWNDINTIKL